MVAYGVEPNHIFMLCSGECATMYRVLSSIDGTCSSILQHSFSRLITASLESASKTIMKNRHIRHRKKITRVENIYK